MNHETLSNEKAENPWTNFTTRELPTTSANQTCRFYLREFERTGKLNKIAHFIDEKLNTEPKTYTSVDTFCADNPNYVKEIENFSQAEKSAIREYSGFRFAWINSVSRGFWDYEKMGQKTPELENEIKNTATEIESTISHAPTPETDFLTFRGTNLDSFRGYNIQNLEDLRNLEGQFYLEDGFTSTAMARDKSFAEREVSDLWIKKSDVEIRYHIPAGSHDSLALLTDELSYSPEQTEVLLNRHSLSYISNVSLNDGHATIDALLIPHEIYEST